MKSKPFYESKVLWFNILFLVVAVAGVFGFGTFQPSATWLEITAVVVAGVNIALRLITTTAIK